MERYQESSTGFSVGMGLTNECNLNCAHCYRSTDNIYRLSLDDVKTVFESVPVSSVGLGTGENALHPEFLQILDYMISRSIKLTMASNGYSLNTIPEDYLREFHDVEVSIDFPTEEDQDRFRGYGNWRTVHAAVDRCRRNGVEVTVLATLMNVNYDRINRIAALARSLRANLRVNVYQSVMNDHFRLTYDQFWEGFRRLFDSSELISCSEPVVCSVLGNSPAVSPCGHQSIRITPEGQVMPCVYWPESRLKIGDIRMLGDKVLQSDEFVKAKEVPPAAKGCPCRGGCAARRALSGDMNKHDDYCPWVRGDEIKLTPAIAQHTPLPRSSNVCTTIVR